MTCGCYCRNIFSLFSLKFVMYAMIPSWLAVLHHEIFVSVFYDGSFALLGNFPKFSKSFTQALLSVYWMMLLTFLRANGIDASCRFLLSPGTCNLCGVSFHFFSRSLILFFLYFFVEENEDLKQKWKGIDLTRPKKIKTTWKTQYWHCTGMNIANLRVLASWNQNRKMLRN